MSTETTEESGWATYRRLLTYVAPYWPAFALCVLGYALYGLTLASQAALMEYLPAAFGETSSTSGIFDRFVTIESPEQLRHVLPVLIIGMAITRGLGSYLGGYYISYVGRNLVNDLRKDLYAHMQLLPGSFFITQGSSRLIAMITYNVEQVTAAATDALRTLFREGLTIAALLTYLLSKNWKLTLIFLVVAPLIGLVVSLASSLLRKYSRRIQNSVGDVTQVASETISAIAEVKTYGAQGYERGRFGDASQNNLRQSLKLVRVTEISSPLIQFITFCSLAVLFWVGLSPELKGDMDTGDFLAYITAAAMIARPLRQLTAINTNIQKGVAAAKSIFDVIDEPAEIDTGTKALQQASGKIEFRNLCFRYPGTSKNVLKDLNLSIEPSQTVALVGRSGAGKTTLANLLARHGNISSGQLLIDDSPIEDYVLKDLRKQLAMVSQHVVLFDDSIANNIAYGELQSASEEEIIKAAKSAHAWHFISDLPEGLETQIGENGTTLSGGQRQRLALARAFLKNAPILILDEATSALDNESERHIQQALQEIMQGRTTIVIAHRLSTIEMADRIVVMDEGQIIETGTHQQLMAKNGAYTQLYRMQFNKPIG